MSEIGNPFYIYIFYLAASLPICDIAQTYTCYSRYPTETEFRALMHTCIGFRNKATDMNMNMLYVILPLGGIHKKTNFSKS